MEGFSMIRNRLLLMIAILVFLAISRVAATGSFRDRLTMKDGSVREVEVIAAKREGIVYALPGQAGQIIVPHASVLEIAYYDRPYDLILAERASRNGRPEKAAEHFRGALERIRRGGCRRLHKQDALIGLARVLRQTGEASEALDTYRDLLEGIPETRHREKAIRESLACAIDDGKVDALRWIRSVLLREPEGSRLQPLAGLARAWGFLLKDRVEEARRLLVRLADGRGTRDVPETHRGLIRALSDGGRWNELHQACRRVVERGFEDPALRALAANRLGDLILRRAGKKPPPETLKRALFHYLRTLVLFGPDRGGSPALHAEAMYGAAECFRRLAVVLPTPEKRQTYQRRSRELYGEILDRYPDTVWAEKVEKQLKRIDT
jgi:tetratricopeptide (TPR) repeat protein